jgi:O-antigen ligase
MQSGESRRADAEHNQPHNDLLNAASTGGVLKLMAYVFLITAPFMFFYKKYKASQQDVNQRILPIMGMQVVAAFFMTGLTNSNFDLQIYSTTFAVVVCVLAKLVLFEQRENI